MSHPLTIYWPPSVSNKAVIASSQPVGAGGNLVLNSNIPSSQVNPANVNGPYIFDKVARTVSFTSVPGYVGTITITGIGSHVDTNGNPTQNFSLVTSTESYSIPANDTDASSYIWKQINSISIGTATTGLSAGFGISGITDYMFMDSNRTGWYATAQVQVINANSLSYTVYQSLTKPETPNIQYGNLNVFPQNIPATPVPHLINNVSTTGLIYEYGPFTGAATPAILLPLTTPVAMVWATISNTAYTNESLYFTTLQQGLRS
jgi:hypothetical protein